MLYKERLLLSNSLFRKATNEDISKVFYMNSFEELDSLETLTDSGVQKLIDLHVWYKKERQFVQNLPKLRIKYSPFTIIELLNDRINHRPDSYVASLIREHSLSFSNTIERMNVLHKNPYTTTEWENNKRLFNITFNNLIVSPSVNYFSQEFAKLDHYAKFPTIYSHLLVGDFKSYVVKLLRNHGVLTNKNERFNILLSLCQLYFNEKNTQK